MIRWFAGLFNIEKPRKQITNNRIRIRILIMKKFFTPRQRKLHQTNPLHAYAMLTPAMIGMFVFVIYPLIWVMRWCLFSYDGYYTAIYVGFDNFVRAFTRDPDFWESVLNTFIFAFGKLAIELPLALGAAYVLNKKFRGRNFCRTAFFLPTIISVAIIGIVFYYLFASYDGVINGILTALGWINSSIDWFANKWTAMAVLGIASVWQNFGINMIFFLTGLQTIPVELYESGDVDGVNAFQKFFRITLPMLGPVLTTVVMVALLGSLKVTDLVLVLTNGAPAGHTEVMMTNIFKKFFGNYLTSSDYGYGAALVVITAIILGIVTFVYLKVTKKSSEIY